MSRTRRLTAAVTTLALATAGVLVTSPAGAASSALTNVVFAASAPPTAADITYTHNQNTRLSFGLFVRAGDAANPIVYALSTLHAPAGAVISADGRMVTVPGEGTYTLDPVYNNVDFQPERSFTGAATPVPYTVYDTQGVSASASIRLTVRAWVPVAAPDVSEGRPGMAQSVDPWANDAPGHIYAAAFDRSSLTYLDAASAPVASLTVADQGTYTIADGKLVFTSLPDFVGEATPATYRVSDVYGTTVTATYTPTVLPNPKAVADATTALQGAPQTVSPLDNDIPAAAYVPFNPATLTLLDANGAPTASRSIAGVGTYTLDGTRITFRPLPAFVGQATPVTYRVADLAGATTTATYTPDVTRIAQPDTATGFQGRDQIVDVGDNDRAPDGSTVFLVFSLVDADGRAVPSVSVPGVGSYSARGPSRAEVLFRPEPGFVGVAPPLRYQVRTLFGTLIESTFTATVTAVTTPDATTGPQGVAQSVDPLVNETAPGTTFDAGTLQLIDASGAGAASVTTPGQGTFTLLDGRIVFTPERDFTGVMVPVRYQVTDRLGYVVESTYTATVTGVTPAGTPDTASGPQGVALVADVVANDVPGDAAVPLVPSTVTLLDTAGDPVATSTIEGQGTYSVADGKLVFTPLRSFTGAATSATYRVADANGTTTTATFTPTLLSVVPTAAPDTSTGTQGAPQSVDPLRNDTAGDATVPFDAATLTLLDADEAPVASIEVAGQGTFAVASGTLVFTPVPRYAGSPAAVSYRVADANGTTTTSTYAPAVTRVAKPDVTTDRQGATQSVDPLENDDTSDVTLDVATLMLLDADDMPSTTVTLPGSGTFTTADGAVTFAPEPAFTGFSTVRYQVADTDGNVVESDYTVTVTAVTPVARPDASSGSQGTVQSVNPVENDVQGDATVPFDLTSLTLLDASGGAVASITIDGVGTYTVAAGRLVFTAVPGFVGSADAVTYRVADANGTTTGSTYTAAVTAGVPVPVGTISAAEPGVVGQPVSIDPSASIVDLVPGSVRLVDASGELVERLEVDGEGVWTVDTTTGIVTFTPAAGFTGDPAPVAVRGYTTAGEVVSGVLGVSYAQPVLPEPVPEPEPAPAATPVPVATSAQVGVASQLLAVTGSHAGRIGFTALTLLLAGVASVLVARRWTARRD